MSARGAGRAAGPVLAGIATVATLATIGPVFSNQDWLLTSVLVVAAVVASGIALRLSGLFEAYVSLLQLLIGLYALLLLTSQPTMMAGFIPSADTFEHVLGLLREGASTARTKVAPIQPTDGTATLLALLVTPVAVLVDDFAATHRPALTGIPLLTLFAICAAIVRHPISMWLVAVPLVAYLLLLWVADTDPPAGRSRRAGLGGLLGTAVILAVAIGIASAVTVVVRLPDGGIFAVPGTQRSPNETVARSTDLAGQLSRGEPIPLFTVTTDDPSPYYLRTLVLENWQDSGWDYVNVQEADTDLSAIAPGPISNATATSTAVIQVEKYSDIFVPTYYSPIAVDLPGARYDSEMSVVYTQDKGEVQGRKYQVTSQVPRPTEAELATQSAAVPESVAKNAVVPNDVDPAVVALTETVTEGADTPWQVAVALDSFFSDPAQGFSYSLEVPDPEGADPLASFLDKRVGFCEQYASAMASMFRIAGVPARVVVGYTNGTLNPEGQYEITTDDAHAWVEAYFGDAGWVSFDPTPIGERAVPLPYVPSDQINPGAADTAAPQTSAGAQPTASESPTSQTPAPGEQAGADAAAHDGSRTADLVRWVVVALLGVGLLVLPALVRRARWRRRLTAASAGGRNGALAAWAEIAELAGALGSPAVASLSEGAQARRWAGSLGADAHDLESIGAAAERARYSDTAHVPAVADELIRARAGVRRASGRMRWSWATAVPSQIRRIIRRIIRR